MSVSGKNLELREDQLRALLRFLDLADGFALAFVESNRPSLSRALRDRLSEELGDALSVVELHQSINDLFAEITAKNPDGAVLVIGLEYSVSSEEDMPTILTNLNRQREHFRSLPDSVILVLPSYILGLMARAAPDFWAWRSLTIEIESETPEERFISTLGYRQVQALSPKQRKGHLEVLLDLAVKTPNNSLEWAKIQRKIGLIRREQGNLQSARSYFEAALDKFTQILGDNHGLVGASLHQLASVLHEQGDLDSAREKLERSLKIAIDIFGTEHPNVAASLSELASVLHEQGDLDGAREKLEHSLKIGKSAFGTDRHPHVATALHELARVLLTQGDLRGAREKFERSLEISENIFGTEEHPDVAISLEGLAIVLEAQGDLDGARKKLERSLEVHEKVFGNREHYHIAISEMNYAMLLSDLGEIEKAKTLLHHAFSVLHRVLGEKHQLTARCRRALDELLAQTGDAVNRPERSFPDSKSPADRERP